MPKRFVGYLHTQDPLYSILVERIFYDVSNPTFRVYQISYRQVYMYLEEQTSTAIVCKFFDINDQRQDRLNRLRNEFDNLLKLRSYGFTSPPYVVVRPITKEDSIGLSVVEEYIDGRDLDYFFKKSVFKYEDSLLRSKLTLLAGLFSEIHKRTMTYEGYDVSYNSDYMYRLVDYLSENDVLNYQNANDIRHLIGEWGSKGILHNYPNCIIHGDATPTNFIYTGDDCITVIDLERMRFGDPAYDIGLMCGEIKHCYMWRFGDGLRAEPFIRHFLKQYVKARDDNYIDFSSLTKRTPFYMALAELRIARNKYLDWNYRKRLANEALECLKGGIRL